jgi:26S proteasome regulatory subunit N1
MELVEQAQAQDESDAAAAASAEGVEDQQLMDEAELIPVEVMNELARKIAAFFLDHNGEPDACDLLYEMGLLSEIPQMAVAEGRDHSRVCLYLLSCVPFEADGDDRDALRVARQIYRLVHDYPHAIVLALRLGEPALVREDFLACPDAVMRLQLAYILARHCFPLDEGALKDVSGLSETSLSSAVVEHLPARLQSILNNTNLCDSFKALAKELEIVEPKSPEDIYKSHLQESQLRIATGGQINSPKQNLAAAFVNGFVNAGFGSDHLLTSFICGMRTWVWANWILICTTPMYL